MRFVFIIVFSLLLNAKVVVTPYMSKQLTSPPNKNLQDSEGIYGVGMRGYLTDKYAIDLRLEGSNGNLMEDGGRTDIERGSVNIFYDVYPDSKVSHYLFGGMGYEQLHRRYLNAKSQPFVNGGLGVRMSINRYVEIMTEAKYLKKLDTHDSEVIGSFGFGYIFANQVYKEKDYVGDLPEEQNDIKKSKKRVAKVFMRDENQSKDINSTLINSVKDERDKKFVDEIFQLNVDNNLNKIKILKGNYIQVAVLTQEENLKNCINKLKSKGFKTTIIKKQNSSIVYVGPYSDSKIDYIYRRVKKIYKDAFYKKL